MALVLALVCSDSLTTTTRIASTMICEHCTQGYVVPGEPQGKMVSGAYFHAGSPSSRKSRAIVVFTDIFGLPLVNCKIIADELSKRVGCDVWVPDLFDGAWRFANYLLTRGLGALADMGDIGRPPFTTDELVPILPDTGKPDDVMGFMRKLRLIFLGISRAFALYRARNSVVDARATAVRALASSSARLRTEVS